MSADSFDDFDYIPEERSSDEAARRHYWAVAIGLQAVDGLEVSDYVRKLAKEYESGSRSLEETGELIRAYHANGANEASTEADLVSQRIAELLADGSFAFTPDMLPTIHEALFRDLDEATYRPGQFKEERLVKQEDILNGDSVLYADPSTIAMSLDYLFREEARTPYSAKLTSEDIERLTRFIAHIWQVHPFNEGNTRTVAVFSELYLNSLGFSVTNEPFEQHARYYRDALVRANYRNNEADILPDTSFLARFYATLLGLSIDELNREELLCIPLFENPSLLKNIDPSKARKSRQ